MNKPSDTPKDTLTSRLEDIEKRIEGLEKSIASLTKPIASLTKRIESLEKKPKDFWDRFQIIAAILIPASIAIVGYVVSDALKEAEIVSAEKIAEGNREVAEINARVAQARLIHSFTKSLTVGKPEERTLAVNAIAYALPDVAQQLLESVRANTTEPTVKTAASAVLAKMGNGARCDSKADCLSNYCYPVPPDNSAKYCLAANMNCAFPDSYGYKYGQTVIWEGKKFECYRPPSGPAKWRPR